MARVAFLLILLAIGGADAAIAQSRMDAIRERLTPELGPPDEKPLAAYRHTMVLLPGTWALLAWPVIKGLDDDDLATQCGRSRAVIGPDLDVRLERVRANGEVIAVAGSIRPWTGRLFALTLDEAAYVAEFLALPERLMNEDMALSMRRSAYRLLVLTPRDDDLLVGYDVLGTGDTTLFIRCPGTAP